MSQGSWGFESRRTSNASGCPRLLNTQSQCLAHSYLQTLWTSTFCTSNHSSSFLHGIWERRDRTVFLGCTTGFRLLGWGHTQVEVGGSNSGGSGSCAQDWSLMASSPSSDLPAQCLDWLWVKSQERLLATELLTMEPLVSSDASFSWSYTPSAISNCSLIHTFHLLVIKLLFIFDNWEECVGRSIFLTVLHRKEKQYSR